MAQAVEDLMDDKDVKAIVEGDGGDESKTTVGKIDDKSCIVMLYDVDMEGLQKLMSSDYLVSLMEKMNIKNEEMHSFEPVQA